MTIVLDDAGATGCDWEETFCHEMRMGLDRDQKNRNRVYNIEILTFRDQTHSDIV